TWSTAGTDADGCSWKGTSKPYTMANQGLPLAYLLIQGANGGGLVPPYWGAWAAMPDSWRYPITVTCPGNDPSSSNGPLVGDGVRFSPAGRLKQPSPTIGCRHLPA